MIIVSIIIIIIIIVDLYCEISVAGLILRALVLPLIAARGKHDDEDDDADDDHRHHYRSAMWDQHGRIDFALACLASVFAACRGDHACRHEAGSSFAMRGWTPWWVRNDLTLCCIVGAGVLRVAWQGDTVGRRPHAKALMIVGSRFPNLCAHASQ